MVVKASPASSFIVTEAKFLLEFLIVALDPPAHFGGCDERLEVGIGRKVESQYLVGALSPCGHSTSSHSSG